MSFDFTCPECGVRQDADELPTYAGDTEEVECRHCEMTIKIGWRAVAFAESLTPPTEDKN